MNLTKIQSHVYTLMLESTKPVCWLGTVRAGKTFGSMYAILSEALKVPSTYVVAAYTYNNHDKTTIPYIEQMLAAMGAGEFKLNRTYPYRLSLENGSVIHFAGAHDESSYKAIQGMTIRGAVVDECLLVPKSFVMQLVARMSMPNPFLLMTANKSAPNNWLKREWLDQGRAILVESGLDENPHITEATRNWYDNLITGHARKNMLENDWAAVGQPICKSVHWAKHVDVSGCERVVRAEYEDPAFTDSLSIVHVGRNRTEDGLTLHVSHTPPSRPVELITNRNHAHILFNPKYGVLADGLGAYAEIFVDDEELACDLDSLIWIDRGKPCPMPSKCVATAMASDTLRHITVPINKPEEL